MTADGHRAVPVDGSWYSEDPVRRANLNHDRAYPVLAACQGCRGRIRLASRDQEEWAHVPAYPVVRGTAEGA